MTRQTSFWITSLLEKLPPSWAYRDALFVPLLPAAHPLITLFLVMLGKFGVLAGNSVLYVFTSELSPTVIRNTAVSSSATFSRLGSSVSSYLLQLSELFHLAAHTLLPPLSCVLSLVWGKGRGSCWEAKWLYSQQLFFLKVQCGWETENLLPEFKFNMYKHLREVQRRAHFICLLAHVDLPTLKGGKVKIRGSVGCKHLTDRCRQIPMAGP